MPQELKELLSVVALIITFVSFAPYIRSIYKGITKPHVFSWIIWGATTFIVFFAQLASDGGLGAWPIGASGLISIYVAVLAYFKKSDCSISKSDWAFFTIAILSLPLWFITADPTWAVIILTTIDVIGFAPTLRKAYEHPYEEQILFYLLFAIRNAIAIFALEAYSVATLLFPIATGIACILFITIVAYRRKVLSKQPNLG